MWQSSKAFLVQSKPSSVASKPLWLPHPTPSIISRPRVTNSDRHPVTHKPGTLQLITQDTSPRIKEQTTTLSGGHVTLVSRVHRPAGSSKLPTQGQEGRERARRSGKKEKQVTLEPESLLGRVGLSQTADDWDRRAFRRPLCRAGASASPWGLRTDSGGTQSRWASLSHELCF